MTLGSKPTVLIIPGGCHLPLHYEPLTKVLSSHGFPSVALRLPTAGASPPDKDLHDDIGYITSKLEELVEKEGKEVIVVLHSYGGTPGPPAARPFVKKERAQQGKNGGVIGLLYISSWGVPSGKSTMESIEVVNNDWMKIEGPTGFPSNGAHVFYNDIPPADADFYASKLVTHCWASMNQPVPADCLNGVLPSVYLVCENDNAVPVSMQEQLAKNIGEGCHVERCSAGHSPFISQPEVVTRIIRRMAGEDI